MTDFFLCSFLECFMAHQSQVKEHLWVPGACGVFWGPSKVAAPSLRMQEQQQAAFAGRAVHNLGCPELVV